MSCSPRLRPITDAHITVVPADRRDTAFAKLARLQGWPALRPVSSPPRFIGSPADDDVVVGLSARIGCSPTHELVGLVTLRERYAQQLTVVPVHATERVFLIEALTVAEEMLRWHPPLRALLAATAAILAATISHDPNYRTFVACRAPADDELAEEAIEMIGGQPLRLEAGTATPMLSFGNISSSELRFLDGDAAALCARMVLGHMVGSIQPSRAISLRGPLGRSCEGLLTVKFPRLVLTLREEIEEIGGGRVNLGWKVPSVAGNDVSFPLRPAANAARI